MLLSKRYDSSDLCKCYVLDSVLVLSLHFYAGYVCLRAFDLATREPKILAPRLHQSGASIVKAPVSRRGQSRGRPRKESPKSSEAPNPVAVVTQIDLDLSPIPV